MTDLNLKLRIGIGDLKFGQSQAAVKELLGDPDKIFVSANNDDHLVWEFNQDKLRLTFYPSEGNKLGYITCKNNELLYKQKPLISNQSSSVLGVIFEGLEWETDDYEQFSVYFNEEYWFSMHAEFGAITQVELGVPFLNDNEYDWPK